MTPPQRKGPGNSPKAAEAPLKIGVIAKTHRTDFAGHLQDSIAWLEENGCQVWVDRRVVREFDLPAEVCVDFEQIPEKADVIIVFGGDGTLLSAARLVTHHPVPILGVNLGSLGFMTEVTLEELPLALERLLSGDYKLSSRCVLKVELSRASGERQVLQALNDAVINKAALARIISLDAYCNDDFIANFLADGMIIATPTGSTAYSLSAGGPIVFPTEDLITLTPICPHTLTNRPLIIPADYQVRVILRSGEDVMLTVDGQVGLEMSEGDVLTCTQSEHRIELIQPGHKNFFDILREKLKWGERF